jgi:phage terminase large subunit
MLPAYSQGRKAIWTAVNPHTGKRRIDEAFPPELRANTNEQEMFIRFKTGATWQVLGSDRYDAAVGSPPAGITFSEWALSNPAAWAYLAPILIENNGWGLFITTARGRNHAHSMLEMAKTRPDWFSEVLPVNATGAMTEAAVEAQRLEYTGIFGKEAADALIDQEYYCSFEAAILGAYWGKEMLLAEQQGRICDVPVNTDLPVHTAWDLGVDDAMAIWCFQLYLDHIDIVDYYEGHGQGLDHYADWLDQRGYHGTDWVPHDAKFREMGTPGARTRIETMVGLGRKPELVPDQPVMDGINAGRKTIPLARFDKTRCAQGLEALRSYRVEWDEKARAFKMTPEHNWASHGADAWRYLSLSWRTDARAGAREGADRHLHVRPHHGPVHGPRGRLVEAGGKSLGRQALPIRALRHLRARSTKAKPLLHVPESVRAWSKRDVAAQFRLEPVEPREPVESHVWVGRHPRIVLLHVRTIFCEIPAEGQPSLVVAFVQRIRHRYSVLDASVLRPT